jgi:hypothetical protein
LTLRIPRALAGGAHDETRPRPVQEPLDRDEQHQRQVDERVVAEQQLADERQVGHPRHRHRCDAGDDDAHVIEPDEGRQPDAGAPRVERQRDVLGDGQRLEQREMLEDHADAEPARAGRIGDGDVPAVPLDPSGVRFHDAVDDLHQRRLAGAVLAQHRVDLAWPNGEMDAVVGDDRRIALGDAGEAQARRVAHRGRNRRRSLMGPTGHRSLCLSPGAKSFDRPAAEALRGEVLNAGACAGIRIGVRYVT